MDQEGTVLESYVSKRRDRRTTLKVLRKLLSKYGSLVEIVTDKLATVSLTLSYFAISCVICTLH
ncbi:DDE-type integrase/transposase/recombinase [Ahrensia kielensis]|uniref:DDE-type integrase/transposase/recombinase n=1 Tax=Ahrensia kielensis TaxID=76980 RepID=UPI003CCC8651